MKSIKTDNTTTTLETIQCESPSVMITPSMEVDNTIVDTIMRMPTSTREFIQALSPRMGTLSTNFISPKSSEMAFFTEKVASIRSVKYKPRPSNAERFSEKHIAKIEINPNYNDDDLNPDKFAEASIKYNRSIRILGILASIGIAIGFSPSVYRFIQNGKWLSNPLAGTIEHAAQATLSFHTLSALFWTLLCTAQVIMGSLMINNDQIWLGRKCHIFMGRYILPFIILFMNVTALMILFDEKSKDRVHISIVILNTQACFFIILWAGLGYYFIFKKQYLRHKDCMIAVFITTFIPGLLRLVRYTFQLIYYIQYKEYCIDVNPFPYLIMMAIIIILTIGIAFGVRNRLTLKQPHNLLFFSGLFAIIIFPCFTMEFNMNPCAWVNLPDSELGIVVN